MIQNNKVEFDPKEHKYTVNGKAAISVTGLLQAVGITEDMSKLPKNIQPLIEAARERGNYYDKLATEAMEEMKFEEEDWDLDEWQSEFIEQIRKFGADQPNSQLRLGIDSPIILAGSPDILEEIEIIQDGKKYVGYCGDLKATHLIKIIDVTWQTNIYTYLRDRENHEKYIHFVVHWDEKNERFTTIQLKTIPNEIIEKVFVAYQLGELYEEQIDDLVDISKMEKLLDTYNKKVEEVQKIEKELNDFKDKLIEKMEESVIKTAETPNYIIKFTRSHTRNTVAWAKIAEERNQEKIKKANEFLKKEGKEEIILETNDEVKKTATKEEEEKHTTVSQVKASVKIEKKEPALEIKA